MRLPISIQAIPFRVKDKKIEYLLFKRIPKKGGFWQPISGGLEEGETLTNCVLRELKEEAGIKNVKCIIPNIYFFQYEGKIQTDNKVKTGITTEYVYGVEVSNKTRVDLSKNIYAEHSEYVWCSYDEAKKLLKWDSNKESLKKLNTLIKRM